MRVQLFVQMKGASYPWNFTGNAFQAGRSMDCELSISGPDSSVVSSHHARLEFSAQGLTVWDLRSKNGTFLNGRRIDAPHPVNVGDEIHLGMNGPKLKILEIDHPAARRTAATVSHGAGASYPPQTPFVGPSNVPTPINHKTPPFGSHYPSHDASYAPPVPVNRSGGPTPTRMLLLGVMAKQRRLWVVITLLVLLLAGGAGVMGYFFWYKPNGDKNDDPPFSNESVYKKALLSACWVRYAETNKDGFEKSMNGSGCVFDRKKRLILTNYHVVEGLDKVEVYFPEYQGDELIRNGKHYIFKKLAKTGTVLKRDKTLDLAVVQVDEMPSNVVAVPFAERSAKIGSQVHMVGGKPRGAGNEVWVYGRGVVRGNYRDKFKIVDADSGQVILLLEGKVLLSNVPSNRGDSGAGVVNDQGMLVGLNNAAAEGVGNSLHVDVTEVKRFLRNNNYYD